MRGSSDNRRYILPSVLAWTAGILFLVIIIFDLPVLRMPHALGVVDSIGILEPAEEDAADHLPDDNGGNLFVRYVAMGEERTSVLKNAPRGLKEGDTVTVAYSEEDPYDITAVRVGRYFLHGTVFAACVIAFACMWYASEHGGSEAKPGAGSDEL